MANIDLNSNTDPNVLQAISERYGNHLVCLLPLDSGRVAVFGRDFQLYDIIEDSDAFNFDWVRLVSQELYTRLFNKSKFANEARFYGEPDSKTLARELKASRANQLRPKEDKISLALDFDL